MNISSERLNQMAERVGKSMHKWWVDLHTGAPIERNLGEILMLVVSELGEAMEGYRRDLMDDKIPHRKMVEVELTDTLIRLLDLAWHKCPGGLKARARIPVPHSNFAESLYFVTKLTGTIHVDPFNPLHYSNIIAMILDIMAAGDMDFLGAFDDKMEYNDRRHDHTREGRLEEHSKKF